MASQAFYPDLAEPGALAEHLLMGIGEIDNELLVKSWPEVIEAQAEGKHFHGTRLFHSHSSATIYCEHRSVYLYLEAERRMFCINFAAEGVEAARAHTSDLVVSASFFRRWGIDHVSPDALDSEFSCVELTERKSALEEVESRWNWYQESIAEGDPDLVAFFEVASLVPELRQLYPFKSVYYFCFSRCTHYPFTKDCPYVKPKYDSETHKVITNYYQVLLHEKVLGEGNAQEVVQIVLQHLPEGCGPAVSCSADYL
ncbi:DUF6193 family natural product biosynthesis protein [Gimesia aquarii]|uniref:Uncharacterized protein n=1 Tax=Gimesia aquarii TaxID=2527964 RepID=A0A517VU07_9PLAN|nr:DUF6193 family natural product biosynthesis protein [Gimesia aquarii]QDT96482.1 hypothetical protein V144x_19390 [Gimesia aquarii]